MPQETLQLGQKARKQLEHRIWESYLKERWKTNFVRPNSVDPWIGGSRLCILVDRKVSDQMRRIESPVRAVSRQQPACNHPKRPPASSGQVSGAFWNGKEGLTQFHCDLRTRVRTVFALSFEVPAAAGTARGHYGDGPRACFNFFKFNSFTSNVNFFQPHEMRLLIPQNPTPGPDL